MEKLCTCLLSGVLVVNEVGVEGRGGGWGQSSVASLLIIAFLVASGLVLLEHDVQGLLIIVLGSLRLCDQFQVSSLR